MIHLVARRRLDVLDVLVRERHLHAGNPPRLAAAVFLGELCIEPMGRERSHGHRQTTRNRTDRRPIDTHEALPAAEVDGLIGPQICLRIDRLEDAGERERIRERGAEFHGPLVGLQLGGVATVTLTFPTSFHASTAELKYYKVNETGFYEFLGATFDRVANTVTLNLTDGGSGDSDVIANSVIIDPGGVAVPVSAGGAGWCFIATAAYGTYWEPHVMTLRQFRDSYLLTNKLGTKFVETYYKYSPPMANYIAEHDSLRSVARIGLAPLVGFSWLALNYGMMAALAVLFGVLTMFIGSTCLVVHKREAN